MPLPGCNISNTFYRTMTGIWAQNISRKAYPSRTISLLLAICLLQTQFLLTFAQGSGPGGVETVSSYEFEIEEEKPIGTLVGTIRTVSGLSYKFSEEPREFSLDSATGQIKTSAVIDRESLDKDTFDLYAQSTPTANYLVEIKIKIIDINDNSPKFDRPVIDVTFSENSPTGTQVLLDTATDPDLNDSVLNYEIVSGNDENKFKLFLFTETRRPKLYIVNNLKLDREVQDVYNIRVSAKDKSVPPKVGYVLVKVTIQDHNDNPPVFDESEYSAKVNETVPVGTSVIQVRATDTDTGRNAEITYEIVNDDRNQFDVDSKTGVVTTLKKLICSQTCSSDSLTCDPNSCVITIEARDAGEPQPLTGRAYVTVQLVDQNDHDPEMYFRYTSSNAPYAVIDEGAKVDTIVAVVTVTDKDEGLNGKTSIAVTKGNELGHFKLDLSLAASGINFIQVASTLDREVTSKYNLTIQATDFGTPVRSSTRNLIILVNDTNDHEPIFKQQSYHAALSELSPVGSFVASVTASDNDTGINAQIYYRFVSGNTHDWFRINPVTGLVTTNKELDREILNRVVLKIEARDSGAMTHKSITNLTVDIWDENDETPTFQRNSISTFISENDSPGKEVVYLETVDNDQGANGTVRYSFSEQTNPDFTNMFQLNPTSGQITTLQKIDREKFSQITLFLVAKDQGIAPLSSTATVNIFITDVNDNDPVFYPVSYYATVKEYLPPFQEIAQIKATDLDHGTNGEIEYGFKTNQAEFTIEKDTGVVKTQKTLIKAEKAEYRIEITAKDKGQGQRQAVPNAMLEIAVISASDIPPVFVKSGYSFSVVEDGAQVVIGRQVGQVSASVQGVATGIIYSISSGDENNAFRIEANGQIQTNKGIDHEIKSVYMLRVAARKGPLFAETKVNITVIDINDNPPVYVVLSKEIHVSENKPVGSFIYNAEALDKDSGENAKIKYSLTTTIETRPFFKIENDTGVIYLQKSLLLKSGQVFSLRVDAANVKPPKYQTTLNVKIHVDDVNDHNPIFEQASYDVSVEESRPVNDLFFKVVAFDRDIGSNGRVTYSILKGNEHSFFGIFPDGNLFIAKSLDRELRSLYNLLIAATDMGTPHRASFANITIHITDSNDNSPVFDNQTYNFVIQEEIPVGSYVGIVKATDKDVGQNAEIKYQIDQGQQLFTIHPKSGVISTKGDIDREKIFGNNYQFAIIASDSGNPKLETKTTVKVQVQDINDNAPKFHLSLFKAHVLENVVAPHYVISVNAKDDDIGENANISYKIISGNIDNKFDIDGESGDLLVLGNLDRELKSEYMLTILATDQGDIKHNATTEVKVIIDDFNDSPPIFVNVQRSVWVSELARIGEFITELTAFDKDIGNNGSISYRISSGDPHGIFQIDSKNGKVYLVGQLDYETKQVYHLNITASDNGFPTLASSVLVTVNVIDENDNYPKFSSDMIVFEVFEGIARDTTVGTISASDVDSGNNGNIQYKILRHTPSDIPFGINPSSGVIYVNSVVDREISSEYKIVIQATDQANIEALRKSAEKQITIVVKDRNDNPPKFVSMNSVTVLQNAPDNTKLTQLKAIDPDQNLNGVITYEFSGGDMNRFRLESATGNLFTRGSLDPNQQSYSLTITARDQGQSDPLGQKLSIFKLTVLVRSNTENGPSFTESSYSGQVMENEPAGTSILEVGSSGPGSVDYYITGITSGGIPQLRYFQVEQKTGVVSTAEVLDRETSKSTGTDVFQVELLAVEKNSAVPKTRSTQVQITLLDQNDTPPHFSISLIEEEISEDVSIGHLVTVVTAADPDKSGVIQYSISDGNDGRFQINSLTGHLTVFKSIDYESKSSYLLEVSASDGKQSSITHVKVKVTDVNDVTPTFELPWYSFRVSENANLNTLIGRVVALDGDNGRNGDVLYTWITHWGADKFDLHPQTGVISVKDNLDFEEVPHYIMTVKASDRGNSPLTSTVTVYINVDDINDNAPIFDPSTYSYEIWENATIGTSILSVKATDTDSGANGVVRYSLVGGDPRGQFYVDAVTGSLYTNGELDRETQAYYNLAILATDQGLDVSRRLSTDVMVSVILKDNNDNRPDFISPDMATVKENTPINTVFFKVVTVDKDERQNAEVEYHIRSNPGNKFLINPLDGSLKVNGALDRESVDHYILTIAAVEKIDKQKSTLMTLTVEIVDDNDHDPVFKQGFYRNDVYEDIKVGTSVIKVSASDVDIGINGELRYIVTSGDDNGDFYMDSLNGILSVQKKLDYERKNLYNIEITVQDLGEPFRKDTARIQITIKDVNDCSPVFPNSPYVTYIQENAISVPIHVRTVVATDADTRPYATLTYALEEGDFEKFSVNSTSGEIEALKTMDRETKDVYLLKITAEDSGVPSRTGTATVTVFIQDTNDHAPVFQQNHYIAHITENMPESSPVLQVHATDEDEGQNALISYALAGDSKDFKIDSESGEISTVRELDREMKDVYDLTIIATDGGVLSNSGTAAVTVIVDDVNEYPPVFEKQIYKAAARMPTLAGSFILGATATDHDTGLNGQILYTITGNDANNFQIDSQTGVVTARSQLPSTVNVYKFIVRASDRGVTPLVSESPVEVSMLSSGVTDFPVFNQSEQSFSQLEDTDVGHVITTVSATSRRQNALVSYSIAGGNMDNTFHLSASGQLKLNKELDFETRTHHRIYVEAKDNLSPSLSSYLPININVIDSNDNAPSFDKSYYNVTVMEEVNSAVVKVLATDPDAGLNGHVTYDIIGGNEGHMFSIDGNSGQIRTTQPLDRERVDSYSLTIQATDQGSSPKSSTAVVKITVLDKNDQHPIFSQIFLTRISENSPVGTFVLRITSTDADIGPNQIHVYSLTSNSGGKFEIDPKSGNITVAGKLDRETKDTYILKVTASDGAYQTSTHVTIDILDSNDNSPQFDHLLYMFKFTELQPEGTHVGTVHASDNDANGPNSEIYYFLKTPSKYFSIDMNTGVIKCRNLLKYFENKGAEVNMVKLNVLATDRGSPPLRSESVVEIEVTPSNKYEPVFEKKIYNSPVAENNPVNSQVANVHASDEHDVGQNAEIVYSLIGGNGSALFAVHRETGAVTLTSSLQGQSGKTFSIRIKAEDKGQPPKSSFTMVTFPVTVINRYRPVFSGSAFDTTIPENKSTSSTIATVSATDQDTGLNGQVAYYVTGGNENNHFDIDENNGYIKIQNALDYETEKVHILNVTARDRGIIPQESIKSFTVYVTDVNDNPPKFKSQKYQAYIPENSRRGTSFFQASATDLDSDADNTIIEYSFQQQSDKFGINRNDGVVTSLGNIDYEEQKQYYFTLKAVNPGTSFTATAQLTIDVTSENEFAPKFSQKSYEYRMSESDSPGVAIGSVRATDDDLGKDGVVEYYLVADSNLRGFAIDKFSGEITTEQAVDREATSFIQLNVLAKNVGPIVGNDTDSCVVKINIGDANDPPRFTQTLYEAVIPENSGTGASVTKVSAVDNDEKVEYRTFTYRIIGGNTGSAFSIESSSGVVKTTALLDRETISEYNVIIGAVDRGSPPKTGTTTVKVLVGDVNDNGPHFDPHIPTGQVTENNPTFSEIGINLRTVTFDLDLSPNQGPYKYRLLTFTDYFQVNEDSGEVQTSKILDRETKAHYSIHVEVKDGGSPTMTSTLTFEINVRDRNDNPSTQRRVDVVVKSADGVFPGGVIGNVKPNDIDLVGDYSCRITSSRSPNFQIPQGCDLYASATSQMAMHQMHTSGNDGIHNSVISFVNVKFQKFDSRAAIANGVLVKLDDTTVQQFLGSMYSSFQHSVQNLFSKGSTTVIFNLGSLNDTLGIFLYVKEENENFVQRNVLKQKLLQEKSQLQSTIGKVIVSVDIDSCQNSPCSNGGSCSSEIKISTEYISMDSPSLILTTPKASLDYRCNCLSGFAGKNCEIVGNKCSSNQCQNQGTCVLTEQGERCLCLPTYTGINCETYITECHRPIVCLNGGSCINQGGTDKCICTDGFAGASCETSVKPCQSSPCYNDGECIPQGTSYKCSCQFGERGTNCEIASKGFGALSYMEYNIPFNQIQEPVRFEFATVKKNALLVYSVNKESKIFIALEVLNGKVRFSFALGENQIFRVASPVSANDGRFHRVEAVYNGQTAILKVSSCPSDSTYCDICLHNDRNCAAQTNTTSNGIIDISNAPVFVGGVRDMQEVVAIPGLVSTHDFVGCMRNMEFDGKKLFANENPKALQGISDKCGGTEGGSCVTETCGEHGECVDDWTSTHCECQGEYTGLLCNKSEELASFGPDTIIEYKVREEYRRDQLMAQSKKRKKRSFSEDSSTTISVRFRTTHGNRVLLYATNGLDHIMIHTQDKNLRYESTVDRKDHTVTVDEEVTDGAWKNITLNINKNGEVTLAVVEGSHKTDKAPGRTFDLMGLDVTMISVGGGVKTQASDGKKLDGFEGCISEVRIDGNKLPFSGKTNQFDITVKGSVKSNCDGVVGITNDGLLVPLPVIVVIVVFAVILIAISVAFIIIRIRRNRKEAAKQNGLVIVHHNGSIRDKYGNESHQDSGFTENPGDISEEAIIRQHIEEELASKNYNEREISERYNKRPDVIEAGRSRTPLSIDDSIPVVPAGFDNVGYANEPPEHYDIDNASSIAPSDLVDVVGHYRRYRKGTLDHGPPPKYPARHSPDSFPDLSGRGKYSRDSPVVLNSNTSTPLPRQSPAYLNNNITNASPVGHPVNNYYDRPRIATPQNQLSRQSPANMLKSSSKTSPLNVNSMRSTPISVHGLYSSNASDSTSTNSHPIPNGHTGSRPVSRLSRPRSRAAASTPSLGYRATPTKGLTVEEVARLNSRHRPSPISSADILSTSTEDLGEPNINQTDFTHDDLMGINALPPETTSDDGSDGSFTCSEMTDLEKARVFSPTQIFTRLHEMDLKRSNIPFSDTDDDSTVVPSEDSMLPNIKNPNGSLNIEYFVNWGTNFEKLVGVFKDIAQLPEIQEGDETGDKVENVYSSEFDNLNNINIKEQSDNVILGAKEEYV